MSVLDMSTGGRRDVGGAERGGVIGGFQSPGTEVTGHEHNVMAAAQKLLAQVGRRSSWRTATGPGAK